MSKALYRKYRPVSLDTVIGQEAVTKSLKTAIKQGKVNHAYLFTGPRGCGKTSVARIFAHAINNFDYKLEDSYVDIIEIDAASNRGIDNIRELREKATIAPTIGKYKVYIIDEVHMLTKEAFNALLKLLEEPPAHVVFIMATTDPQKLPITITSRAQTYVFKLADTKTMSHHLRKIANSEKIDITDDAITIITRRGGGSFRDSISLLDQISTLSEQKITTEIVVGALGLPHEESINNLLSAYQANDLTTITKELKDILNSGTKPEILVEDLIRRILEHPEPSTLPLLAKLPEVQPPFTEAKLLIALVGNLRTPAKSPSSASDETGLKESANDGLIGVQTAAAGEAVLAAHDNGLAGRVDKTIVPASTTDPAAPTAPFSWSSFLDSLSDSAIHTFLQKSRYHITTTTLHIYPDKSFAVRILTSTNNKTLLKQHSAGLEIEIHDASEHPPQGTSNSSTLQQISDIMGDIQEVNTDAEDIPF